jgi:hypothetical protein
MRVKFSFSCGRLSLLDYEPTYAPDGEVRPRFWSLPLEANDEGGAAFGGMHEQDVVGGICMTPTDRRLAPDTMQAIRCRRLGGGEGKVGGVFGPICRHQADAGHHQRCTLCAGRA